MRSNVDNSSIQLAKAQDFSRVSSLENYEGMLGTLSEDDPKVKAYIIHEIPRYKVEFYRLDVDRGPSTISIQSQGKRPTVIIPAMGGGSVQVPVPEKKTPPINWKYKKIGERLMYDLGSLLMCDIIRIGRLPFNHFFPVLQNGDLDLTVSREHGLILFYSGGLHYVDYGSLPDLAGKRKDGSTNGTYLSNGKVINYCMHEWKKGEYLEFGQNEEVESNHEISKKRNFKIVYSLYEDKATKT
mgnify:CR=1 FL=1